MGSEVWGLRWRRNKERKGGEQEKNALHRDGIYISSSFFALVILILILEFSFLFFQLSIFLAFEHQAPLNRGKTTAIETEERNISENILRTLQSEKIAAEKNP